MLIKCSSWSQNIFQLQKTNSSLNTSLPYCSYLDWVNPMFTVSNLFFTFFFYYKYHFYHYNTYTTITLSHKLTNIYHLLLLMCPEFHFGLQYYYNIPIQHREKWNLKLCFQRWRTEECLVTNSKNISALWAMLQITAAPSVKPLKNNSEHFPLREITSKWQFYSICTFGSY